MMIGSKPEEQRVCDQSVFLTCGLTSDFICKQNVAIIKLQKRLEERFYENGFRIKSRQQIPFSTHFIPLLLDSHDPCTLQKGL